jgi:hypothetical protein
MAENGGCQGALCSHGSAVLPDANSLPHIHQWRARISMRICRGREDRTLRVSPPSRGRPGEGTGKLLTSVCASVVGVASPGSAAGHIPPRGTGETRFPVSLPLRDAWSRHAREAEVLSLNYPETRLLF